VSTASPFPTSPRSERDLDLRYYADLLWRGRLFAATAALVGLGLGLFAAWLQAPQYRASAMVQIEPPTPTFLSVTDALVGAGGYWQNTDFYNTQFRILRSRGLGEQVVDRLRLAERPPFQGHDDRGSLFMSHVAIAPVPESRLALIQVTHPRPEEAARWANTLADVYIEQSLANRVEAARRAYEWLQGRLAATQASMREAQERLLRTYQSQDLFVPEGGVSAVSTSIAKLNEDHIEARSRRIALEAAIQQSAEMRQRGQSLEAVPQVAADRLSIDLGGQLAALTLEMTRLREKFKPAHPQVQALEAQMAQVQRAREERAGQIVAGLEAEYAQLSKREGELRQTMEEQKAQAAAQSRKATELEAAKKEAESAKSLYEVLLQKLNETDIAASIRTNNVTLVERASAPRQPVWPSNRRLAGAGLAAGLLLGVGLLLAREWLDNTIRDPEEMERYLHVDHLASVPRYEGTDTRLVTEAYQNLRTALLFARRSEGGQIVLVTGTLPQEGKTTTLVNLAELLAASGDRTLVVDLDLRRAQLHARLGLNREPGLTAAFATNEPLDSLVQPTRVPKLFALTAGALPPNPPALLARRDVADVLARLRPEYEWILLDSPPLASVTDALLLARHADAVVFVVQFNKADKRLVKRNLAALRRATPNLLGAVLNSVDVRAEGYYYSYYHQQPQPDPVVLPSGNTAGPPSRS
jgi:capsular exopolysaccharide synthesis family protein